MLPFVAFEEELCSACAALSGSIEAIPSTS